MPLLEVLAIDVGGAIAKGLLKRWLGSDNIVSDAALSVADVFKERVTDRRAQLRGRQQFEAIGEKVGESLQPLFAMEGADMDEATREAVALAVTETLNTATSALVARHDLEPVEIARQLLKDHPASSYHFSESEGHLYERIVDESCQDIVEIASRLPHFTERTLGEVLLRERHLVEIAERTLQELERLRAALDPQVNATRFELDYRLTVIRKLDELELFGSGMSVTARKYSLSLSYVALSLEQQVLKSSARVGQSSHLFEGDQRGQRQMVRRISEPSSVLAESSYLLLHGDAGSGKTTLLQWIAVQAAAQSFPQELASWNEKVPFFIRLRQHVPINSENKASWPYPEGFPALVAPAIAGAMPLGWVHRKLQEGRAVVLVDGIDEVPAPLRPSVYEWLENLITSYDQARFIVTSRPYAVNKDDLPSQERFKEAQVLPMTLSAMEDFITQWHRAVTANLQDEQERQELREAAKRLVIEIRASRTLQQLATNPLLCAMLCALSRERHQQLPSDRVALYEDCCELLIERRDQERHVSLADYPAAVLSYEQKSLLLSDLAYWLVRNGQTEAAIDQVDERLTRRLGRMVGLARDLQGADARRLFMERSGILREPVKGAIDFTHRTFQEFLAAKAVVDENDIPLLVEHAHDDQWREVVLLTVGLAPRVVCEDLVERLLKRAETRESTSARLYLLAAACTQIVHQEMKREIYSRIEQGLAEMVPLKSVEEVEAMATAGVLAVPHLAPRFEYNPEVAAACVRTLLKIGSEAALNALQAYMTDDTSAVIDALVQGLGEAIDKPAYAQRFLSHVESVSASPTMFELLPFFLHLTSLELSNLSQETDLSVLERLPTLTSLYLFDLPQMKDFSMLERLPGLTSLNLSKLSQVKDLSVLERLSALTSLNLSYLSQVRDLSVLERLSALTSLQLSNLPEVRDLSVLERLPGLTSMQLSSLPQVRDLSVLERLPTLSFLGLSNLSQVRDLSVLERLPGLTSLQLSNLSQVRDLSVLERLPGLTSLELLNLSQVRDLSVLERLPGLTSLGLSDLSQVRDLSVLERLPGLTSLQLSELRQVRDLSVLERLSGLTSLLLSDLSQVRDLSVLERLPGLTSLNLSYLPQVRDLSVLERLEKLKSITVGRFAKGCVAPQSVLLRVRITKLSFG